MSGSGVSEYKMAEQQQRIADAMERIAVVLEEYLRRDEVRHGPARR